jgi:site-specific DNA recombinase
LVVRAVPAIVDEQLWKKAQAVLRSNQIFGKRNARNQYLLRGLGKCGLCGLTYIGLASRRPNGKLDFYYRCNGKHGARGLYGEQGQRCPSKDVNGRWLEQLVWSDIDSFLRQPGPVLEALKARIESSRTDAGTAERQLNQVRELFRGKASERQRVLGLYRRGRIEEISLDAQLGEIEAEERVLAARVAELENEINRSQIPEQQLCSVESLLAKLRKRLDGPLSWELKRQLVEVLVSGLKIDTTMNGKSRQNIVTITYKFSPSVETCTGTRADINCTLARVYSAPRRCAA